MAGGICVNPLNEIALYLDDLKHHLIGNYEGSEAVVLPTKQQVLLRVEKYVQDIIHDLGAGCWPNLLTYGTNESCKLQKRKGLLLFHLLAKVHRLLRSNTTSTKRDIYYEDVTLWTNQVVLDSTVTQLTRLLGVPRHCINISATSKGLVAGSLIFNDTSNHSINCLTATGLLIPCDVDQLSSFRSDAKCILVIEKDSTFQKLIDDKIEHFIGPCILVTAKGYPDVNTRRFLRRLWEELKLPLLALMDADPHGISIMAVYRFGSQKLEDIEHLATPQMRWIGIHPTDIENLHLPIESRIPLTARDRSLINSLMKRPFIVDNEDIYQQLDALRRLDCKVEIQGLVKINQQFLSRTYIPSKLRTFSWI